MLEKHRRQLVATCVLQAIHACSHVKRRSSDDMRLVFEDLRRHSSINYPNTTAVSNRKITHRNKKLGSASTTVVVVVVADAAAVAVAVAVVVVVVVVVGMIVKNKKKYY